MSSPAPRKFPCHVRLTAAGNAWHRLGGCRGAALPHQRMKTGGTSDRPHVEHAHWTKEQHVTFVARVLGVQTDKSCVHHWASIIVHVQMHGHTISRTTDMGATHIVSRSWCVSGSYVSNVEFFPCAHNWRPLSQVRVRNMHHTEEEQAPECNNQELTCTTIRNQIHTVWERTRHKLIYTLIYIFFCVDQIADQLVDQLVDQFVDHFVD